MNRHAHNSNTLLVEIMLAVLFFALCTAPLLQMFSTAHEQSELAALTTQAMIRARSVTEQLNGAADFEAVLTENGFICEENTGIWMLQTEDGYLLKATVDETAAVSGILHETRITASRELQPEKELFTLLAAHYAAGEVSR